MRIFGHPKIIVCPVDGKLKEVFYRTLIYQGLEQTVYSGCEVGLHGSPKCTECASRITIKPVEDLLSQDKIYPPYVE